MLNITFDVRDMVHWWFETQLLCSGDNKKAVLTSNIKYKH